MAVEWASVKVAGSPMAVCQVCFVPVLPWNKDDHDRWHADLDDRLALVKVKIVHTQPRVVGVAVASPDENGALVVLCMNDVGAGKNCFMFKGHPGPCPPPSTGGG